MGSHSSGLSGDKPRWVAVESSAASSSGMAAPGTQAAWPRGRCSSLKMAAFGCSTRAVDRMAAGLGSPLQNSSDGRRWQRVGKPILIRDDFDGLKHIALADVIRRSDGTWLMHVEGMRDGRWTICQARSSDGIDWRATRREPVLTGGAVAWAGADVANPKCVELPEGLLVLGFSGAGPARDFQLGLATSTDGLAWEVVGDGPLRCTSGDERRIESLFLTRDAWDSLDRRAYFFRATSSRTHESSDTVVAMADASAAWPGPPWRSASGSIATAWSAIGSTPFRALPTLRTR